MPPIGAVVHRYVLAGAEDGHGQRCERDLQTDKTLLVLLLLQYPPNLMMLNMLITSGLQLVLQVQLLDLLITDLTGPLFLQVELLN